MTVAQSVELIFLKVNGGKPTPDDSVMRADIKAFLPASFNYAMDKVYNTNLQSEGDRDYPSEFYSVFSGIAINRTETIPYIPLTLGTVPLKSGAGIRFVYDNCQNQYAPLSDADMGSVKYYSKLTNGMYWFRRTGAKLYLYGINPLIEEINYQAITKVEDLSDSDTLPLQAGMEQDILAGMLEWFEQKAPYTTLVNTRDINATDA